VSPRPASLINTAWGFLPDSKPAYVRLHQPNYFLLGRYTSDVNTKPYQPLFDAFGEEGDFKNVESRFQLSVKGRRLTTDDHRWGLWFAYTQQNQWQLDSPDISRPIRATTCRKSSAASAPASTSAACTGTCSVSATPTSRTGKWRDNSFTLMGRGNLSTGRGAAQFTWATRPLLGPLRGYLQVFTGHGESMIDYDWRQTTVGLGVTLNDKF
jgi:outer membrane phospholipase A